MTQPLVTAEELLHTSIPHKRTELVRGRMIVREPPGYQHGRITAELGFLLTRHAKDTHAGQVVSGDTAFHIASDPDTVRGPDIAFIRSERLPDPNTAGFPALAPDLVVEVLSLSDRAGETLAKVGDWLDAGAHLVWVIDPERRLARIYRADGSESIVTADGDLDGETVLPGFHCPVGAIL
jgi:Uma2 family endonuclease